MQLVPGDLATAALRERGQAPRETDARWGRGGWDNQGQPRAKGWQGRSGATSAAFVMGEAAQRTHRALRVGSRGPVADGRERTPGAHPARFGAIADQRHHLGRVRDGAQAPLAFLVGHSLAVLRRRAIAAQLVSPGAPECG